METAISYVIYWFRLRNPHFFNLSTFSTLFWKISRSSIASNRSYGSGKTERFI